MHVINETPDEILASKIPTEELGKLFHARNRFSNSCRFLSKRKPPIGWRLVSEDHRKEVCKLYDRLSRTCEEIYTFPHLQNAEMLRIVKSVYGNTKDDVIAWRLISVNEKSESGEAKEKYRYYLTPDGALLRTLPENATTGYRLSVLPFEILSSSSGLSEGEIARRNDQHYLNQKDLAALLIALKVNEEPVP